MLLKSIHYNYQNMYRICDICYSQTTTPHRPEGLDLIMHSIGKKFTCSYYGRGVQHRNFWFYAFFFIWNHNRISTYYKVHRYELSCLLKLPTRLLAILTNLVKPGIRRFGYFLNKFTDRQNISKIKSCC